ncbi:response regulator [Oricola cellulosilytica]|uniref:Response regulator n=1 Tax=Oricola cellulosilytica TaxID=1429082 RepID=A0A4R0PFG4_9HYPH|nr:response regulator [Oricola cellulosilytica]TCD16576.1 response regulator [Oricola cellulosilytica]
MLDHCSILVAEDEGLIALDLQMTLEDEGATVVGPYSTVESCLDAVEKQSFDFAILDVNLRGRNVFPVAEKLIRRGIPFVFHTGHGDRIELLKKFPDAKVYRKPTEIHHLIENLASR